MHRDIVSKTGLDKDRAADMQSRGGKIMEKKKQIGIALALLAAFVIGLVAGLALGKLEFGKKSEDLLVGAWYADPETTSFEEPYFTLYSDGTCAILMEYGTGSWSVVNDDQLKITNFYGQIINIFDGSSTPMTIVSLEKGHLVLESPDQSMQVDFYNEAG